MITIEAIGNVAQQSHLPGLSSSAAAGKADFGQLLGQLDGSLRSADASLSSLASGQAVPTHEVMISMEKARLELTFAVEVRNRLVEAYQEMMRMQL